MVEINSNSGGVAFVTRTNFAWTNYVTGTIINRQVWSLKQISRVMRAGGWSFEIEISLYSALDEAKQSNKFQLLDVIQ